MPYKEGKSWRGVVKKDGRRVQKSGFSTKRAAREWEDLTRAKMARIQTVTGFLTLCNQYLDYAEVSVSKGVYQEKKSVINRFKEFLETGLDKTLDEISVHEVTPAMCHQYIVTQAGFRSNNAANRDRKNLLKMWNWGNEIMELRYNPLLTVKKLKHDRKPQYTPPTEDVLKVLAVANRTEKLFLNCFLKTGARRSEIFRWTWLEDINFEKRMVRLGTHKSRDGSMKYRWVDMHPELYDSLVWLWKNRPFKENPYVWVSDHPGPN